ncbi:class I SAM-dependent methyltransferase [Cellulomonas sp. NS3]|uniref:class I SAM-dependent methyltransferase n=1 Tax=Cellulomonas sp. NS3 TaxID=2973977 RepID=UPI0021613893|nr:class I SAM-dependent methyltransferase [Cellulomonas sp. NS3]
MTSTTTTTRTHERTATTAPAAVPLAATDLMAPLPADAPAAAFADRVLAAALGSLEITAIHLGERLGWYRALADDGPLTSTELAVLTGTVERYAREWLEQQSVNGYVEALDGAEVDASWRRFRLHAGAAEVLTDVDSLAHVAPLARLLAGTGRVVDRLVEAYRTGGGVGWEELGADAREAQAALNRPMFLHQLTQELLPAVPALHERLAGGATVADVGCGEGWSAIGLALGYPGVRVDGYDVDAPSVAAARRHASTAGVTDRVTFTHVDAAAAGDGTAGRYDVVTAYECVHDMADPVAVLAAMRRMAADDAYVLVVDENAAEEFGAPAGPVERLLYGFSLVCCLPDGLSTDGGAGTGTVMRPSVLAGYAARAGFSRVEVLPVEHDLFRFYRLHL